MLRIDPILDKWTFSGFAVCVLDKASSTQRFACVRQTRLAKPGRRLGEGVRTLPDEKGSRASSNTSNWQHFYICLIERVSLFAGVEERVAAVPRANTEQNDAR